jgi:hypothetical protein
MLATNGEQVPHCFHDAGKEVMESDGVVCTHPVFLRLSSEIVKSMCVELLTLNASKIRLRRFLMAVGRETREKFQMENLARCKLGVSICLRRNSWDTLTAS